MSGIHGRLGDLGSIDKKFDIAISTAAPQLDYLVADTVKEAEKCIAFLRQNNIGRTTFIMLDKMSSWEKQRVKPFSCPQHSKRLFDLVQSKDDIFLNAFYYALRDTLVAENINIGTQIAFQSA